MIVLRTMTEEDIPYVARMEETVFPDPWSEKVYRETFALPDTRYVAAELDGRIVGAAGVRNIAGTGEITNVMVLPGFRRKGIAGMMMKELLEMGKMLGAKEFTLEVRAGNKAAIRLYENLGFVSEGIRPGFYRNPPEDAIIYW